MTTMAMIYGLLPGWLSETCSSALLRHFGPKNRSSNWARRVHQVYPGGWNKSFKAACTEKYDGWLSTVEIHEETAAENLRAPAPRKNYFAVDSWFFGRGHQKVSLKTQDARWTPWTGGKAIWFTATRKDSLVAVDDHCFDRDFSRKFWVNQTQMWELQFWCRRSIYPHDIFRTRIMKRIANELNFEYIPLSNKRRPRINAVLDADAPHEL